MLSTCACRPVDGNVVSTSLLTAASAKLVIILNVEHNLIKHNFDQGYLIFHDTERPLHIVVALPAVVGAFAPAPFASFPSAPLVHVVAGTTPALR